MFQVKISDLLDMFQAPSMPSAVVREALYQALLMTLKASLDAAKTNFEIAGENTRAHKSAQERRKKQSRMCCNSKGRIIS
jgi:hypothetical protein